MTLQIDRRAIDAVVLDIEGTTTPIAFVYDVLFPFARRHLREHLQHEQGSERFGEAIRLLRDEWTDESARDQPPPWKRSEDPHDDLAPVAAYAEWLMDRDRKSTGLKLLQGQMWEAGYMSGALKGDIFPDVHRAIETWRAGGLKVAIYSSGSVLAQRLLFAHTIEGDLTSLFSGFFDTRIGQKSSSDSYARIAAALGCQTDRLLFVSDTAGELDAAHAAGCRTVLCARPGNPPQSPASACDVIQSLAQLEVV